MTSFYLHNTLVKKVEQESGILQMTKVRRNKATPSEITEPALKPRSWDHWDSMPPSGTASPINTSLQSYLSLQPGSQSTMHELLSSG